MTMVDAGPWLMIEYGSAARGDVDPFSDYDVLVLAPTPDMQRIGNSLAGDRQTTASFSYYSWSEFRAMASYGSLFLHHLRSESRILEGSKTGRREFANVLSNLLPYQRAATDVRSFRTAIRDVADSLDSVDYSVPFELSALATVVRHASIVGCGLIGDPCFGRYASVKQFVQATSLVDEIAIEFPSLYEFKLAAAGRPVSLTPSGSAYVRLWLDRASKVVEEVAQNV